MKNIPKKQFVGWMLMLLLCISSSAFAQSPKKVTGRVMDAQGELLIGVNVTEAADPSNGVVTDINGTYTITLKSNKPSLRFSYIGFKDKVVAVGSKGVLDVALEEDVAALDEVVVVGFGTQKKASVVGSITNIEPAKLAAAPSRSLSNNLAGMVPGVIAVQRSGDPWFNNQSGHFLSSHACTSLRASGHLCRWTHSPCDAQREPLGVGHTAWIRKTKPQ